MIAAQSVTQKEMADALGRTVSTISGYVRRGMPLDSVEAAREWIAENIATNGPPTIGERAGAPSRHAKGELDEAEQRARISKLEAEAEKTNIANAVKKGELLQADDVHQQVSELLLMVKHRLEAWPDQIITEFPESCRGVVLDRAKDAVYLLLTEMSQWRLTSD